VPRAPFPKRRLQTRFPPALPPARENAVGSISVFSSGKFDPRKIVTLKFAIIYPSENTLHAIPVDGVQSREALPGVKRIENVPRREGEPVAVPSRPEKRPSLAVYVDAQGQIVKYHVVRRDHTFRLATSAGFLRISRKLGSMTFVRFEGDGIAILYDVLGLKSRHN
jgi:hypothetical protein